MQIKILTNYFSDFNSTDTAFPNSQPSEAKVEDINDGKPAELVEENKKVTSFKSDLINYCNREHGLF